MRHIFSSHEEAKSNSWLQALADTYKENNKKIKVFKKDGTEDRVLTRIRQKRNEFRTLNNSVKWFIRKVCGEDVGYITDNEARHIFHSFGYTIDDTNEQGFRHLKDDEVSEELKLYREEQKKHMEDNYRICKGSSYEPCYMDDVMHRFSDISFIINNSYDNGLINYDEALELKTDLEKVFIFEIKSYIGKLIGDFNVSSDEAKYIFNGTSYAYIDELGNHHTAFRGYTDNEIISIINELRKDSHKTK